MLTRLACIVLLAWPGCAWARDTSSRSERDREELAAQTKTEARAVLTALLRDAQVETTPCRFDTKWLSTPVDASMAQKHLGLTLNVDVVASDLGVGPRDLIDPDDKVRDAFCSEAHAHALWRQMLDDFRSGANPGKRRIHEGKPYGLPSLSLSRAEIAVPVFDRAFTTAIVVAGYTSSYTSKGEADAIRLSPRAYDAAGYRRHANVEGVGYTYVYRKRGGRWRQIDTHQDWTMN